MSRPVIDLADTRPGGDGAPQLSGDMRRHLGSTLRRVYEQTLDAEPIPVSQVDLLLQLRHKERDLRRAN